MDVGKFAIPANPAIEQRVEERARALEEQRLAAAQATAILEERQRLARDLHDSVTQALYGITLHAEVARRLLASGDTATAAGYLSALQETAQEALAEMRLLIFDLRPPILGQIGLAAALQVRLDNVERQISRLDHRDRISERSADRLRDQANDIERRLRRVSRNGLNPYEANEIQIRIANLEQRVQVALSNRYGRYGYNDRDGRWGRGND